MIVYKQYKIYNMRTSGEIDEICKQALEEYLNTPETDRSLTKLGSKYNIKRQTLSERFKKWGYNKSAK